MGSLYDNSGEDIYARRDIEKRRKHAMAMKKKRKRQILKRKIMLFTGAAAILVASLGLTAAVRKNNTASGSSLNPKETQQVAIDANADAANTVTIRATALILNTANTTIATETTIRIIPTSAIMVSAAKKPIPACANILNPAPVF